MKIKVKITHKNNMVLIESDDVPGLWLWGDEKIFDSIIPTIKELYRYNNNIIVDIKIVKSTKTCIEYEVLRKID